MAVVSSVILNRTLKKEYPWLCPVTEKGKVLQKDYPGIIRKTKQVFFHKMGTFVLSQTSPLVIYAYASLTLVAIYGNYMLIVTAVTSLINALSNGINAGVGNLVAEGDKKKIKLVFWQLTTFRMWVASVVCFGIYMLGHSFIRLWVGGEFLIPQSAFVVLLITTFIQLTRVNDIFIAAYGLYQDVWAPAVEASLNLGFSVLLGYYYGLTGILGGVLISLLTIICIWKPYFLYWKGFEESVWEYVWLYLKKIFLLLLAFVVVVRICFHFMDLSADTYLQWLAYAICTVLLYSGVSLGLFYLFDVSLRSAVKRFYQIFVAKFVRSEK